MSQYSSPACNEDGTWDYELDGQVIGPFKTEKEAWQDLDSRVDDDEE